MNDDINQVSQQNSQSAADAQNQNKGIFGDSFNTNMPNTDFEPESQNTNNNISSSSPQQSTQTFAPLVADDDQSSLGNTENQETESANQNNSQEDTQNQFGVDFIDDSQNIQKQEMNIFDKESSFKSKEDEAVGIIPDPLPTPIENSETQKPEEILDSKPNVKTEDLENEFSQTFNASSQNPILEQDTEDHLAIEENKLKNLHKELKDKAAAKKVVVKERLEKLKIEKESLGKELEDIKELESIASKIEEKLQGLQSIDQEIDSLEIKAKEELQ